MQSWKVNLAVLTLAVVIISSGNTMLMPFLPLYLLEELGAAPEHINIWNGAIFSVTFLVSSMMSPLWGKLADKKGKKLLALRSGICLALTYFLGGIATSPEQMFMVRVFHGFASGLSTMCLAMASGLVPEAKMGLSLGFLQAGYSAGTIMGPFIGSSLSAFWGMRTAFFVTGYVFLAVSLIFLVLLPEPRQPKQPSVPALQKDLLLLPFFREILLYVFLCQTAIFFTRPVLSIYVAGLDLGRGNLLLVTGIIFSLVGIAGVIASPLWGHLGQRHGYGNALCVATFCAGVMYIANIATENIAEFAVMHFIYGAFCAGIQPSLSAALVHITPASEKGQAFGFMFSAQQWGSVVGPLFGGIMASSFSISYLFIAGGVIMLAVSVAVCLRGSLRRFLKGNAAGT